MFIRRMIYYKIHNNPDISYMRLLQQLVEIFHITKFSHNILIITDVISIVIIWRFIDR